MPSSVMRLEKTCASKDFSSLRALPCDQSQTQTVENRHQSPRESAADSCQGSFAREEGEESDSFSGLHRSRRSCIANSSYNKLNPSVSVTITVIPDLTCRKTGSDLGDKKPLARSTVKTPTQIQPYQHRGFSRGQKQNLKAHATT